MAIVPTLVDRVKIFTASSGTGPFALGPAVSAYRGSEALVDGNHYSYAVEQNDQYEAGTGEYVLATNSLVRSPLISSNGNAPVAFPANVQVAFTALASDYRYGDGAQLRSDLAVDTGATIVGTASGQTVQASLDSKASAGPIGASGLTQNSGLLLGRFAASIGAVQEITVGTGLALDGSGNLTATGTAAVTWGAITGTLADQADLQAALTARALTGAVGASGLTQNTSKLLGRWSASSGPVQEVTIGSGLALDGSGNLTVSGKADTGLIGSSGLTQNTGKLLGRWTASTGPVQEVTISSGLALDGSGNLTAPPPAWSTITGKPTTLSGYGITDGALNGAVGSSGLTMTTARMLARTTAGTGAIEELTAAQGRTFLGVEDYESNTYTPTITSTSGTITTKSATGRYIRIGKQVTVWATITITTNGTGAGAVRLTLPASLPSAIDAIGTSRDVAVSGSLGTATIRTTAPTTADCVTYNNAYPAANGSLILVCITYQIA